MTRTATPGASGSSGLRHAGDASSVVSVAAFLVPLRDRLLDAAHIQDGDVVLDLGTGDG